MYYVYDQVYIDLYSYIIQIIYIILMYVLCFLYSINTDICVKMENWELIRSKNLNRNFM